MLRVKLKCGDRSIIMAYTSMADVYAAAASRLQCSADEVILTMKLQGEEEAWEIEGEPMLKNAVMEGHVIVALSDVRHRAKRARRGSVNQATSTATQVASASSNTTRRPLGTPPGSPPSSWGPSRLLRSQRSTIGQGQSGRATSSMSGGESGDEGANRISRKRWSDKEDRFLWKALDEELKTLPSPNPHYSLEERNAVFDRITQKHSRKFADRKSMSLIKRVQARVLSQRRANKKLPARINALFPLSRAHRELPTTQTVSRTPDNIALAATRTSADVPFQPSQRQVTYKSVTKTSRAVSAPINPRRPYRGDVIRVQAVHPEHVTRSTTGRIPRDEDSSDSSSEDGQYHLDTNNASRPQQQRTSVRAHPVRNSVERTSRASDHDRQRGLPSSSHPVPRLLVLPAHSERHALQGREDPSSTPRIKQEPSTPDGDQLVQDKADPTSGPVKLENELSVCIPPSIFSDQLVTQQAFNIRSLVRTLLDELFATSNSEADDEQWAERFSREVIATCAVEPVAIEAVSLRLHAALDEFLHHTGDRGKRSESMQRTARRTGILLQSIYLRMHHIGGFDLLLCRLLRTTLFDKNHYPPDWTGMVVACLALVLSLQRYDSVLDGLFTAPWSVSERQSQGTNASTEAQPSLRLGEVESERVFVRMHHLLSGLDAMRTLFRSSPKCKELVANRRKGPPRFKANAWKRLFDETSCDRHAVTWSDKHLFHYVQASMKQWNEDIVNDADFSGLAAQKQPPPQANAGPVRSDRQVDRSPIDCRTDDRASTLFLGLPDFSQQRS